MIKGSFARDQRIVTVNPVLIQEIDSPGQNNQRDEDDDDKSLHSVKTGWNDSNAELSDVGLQNLKKS